MSIKHTLQDSVIRRSHSLQSMFIVVSPSLFGRRSQSGSEGGSEGSGRLTLGFWPLVLADCCSKSVLLFCCYCSTVTTVSGANVRQL